MAEPRTAARELSFETVAAGLHMTRPIRPSTLRDAVAYLKAEGLPPSISPDAGQNRQVML